MLVQDTLKKDRFSGHFFAFRGGKAQLINILFWTGTGCVVSHAARPRTFVWPRWWESKASLLFRQRNLRC